MIRAVRAVVACGLIAVLVLSATFSHLPILPDLTTTILSISQDGSRNWLAFLALQIGVAAIGILPASLLAVAAGAAFGLTDGFLISSAGVMIGGWLAFLLSRSIFRPWIKRWLSRHPRFDRFERAVDADGWRFVCLLRISPVMPFALTSYGLGLTGIGHGSFIVGTLASLPALACYVAMGALGHASWDLGTHGIDTFSYLLLLAGVVATILIALRLSYFLKKALRDQQA